MKKLFTLLPVCLLTGIISANAQMFWVENFESGSTSGMFAGAYTGPNGTWTTASSGTNGVDYNPWFVSCAENGHTDGICGTGCAPTSTTATGATLHVGSSPTSTWAFGDVGASYDAGDGGIGFSNPETNQRAESPTINCTGKYGISMKFYYIENGDGANDDGSVYYYNGTTWALLENLAKTTLCSGQGQWTVHTITLPASADNNANVKIGFNWTNNEDGTGTDPSFAIDSVSLSTASSGSTPVASFTTSSTDVCQDSCIVLTNTSTGTIDSFSWSIVGVPTTLSRTSPFSLCATIIPPGTYGVKLKVYSGTTYDSSITNITVHPSPHPFITRTGHTLSVPSAYLSYQWLNGTTPIAGATNNTYVYATAGTYKVIVDSAGCGGNSNIFTTTSLLTLDGQDAEFKIATQNNGITILANENINELLNITISDATGRNIMHTTWQKGTDRTTIAPLPLAPGLYMVRLSNNNTSTVLKYMKL